MVCAFVCLPANAASPSSWSIADQKAATEAALLIARAEKWPELNYAFIDLSAALLKAGNNESGRQFAEEAMDGVQWPKPTATDAYDLSQVVGSAVQLLAWSGDTARAEALVDADPDPGSRMLLLGRLGRGAAKAGAVELAIGAIGSIAALLPKADVPESAGNWDKLTPQDDLRDPGDLPFVRDPVGAITEQLILAGHSTEAVHAAEPLPGQFEARVLEQAAFIGCKGPGPSADIAKLVTDGVAGLRPATLQASKNDWDRASVWGNAAAALAVCDNSDAAAKYVASVVPEADRATSLRSAAYDLALAGHLPLAEPLLAPSDAQGLQKARGFDRYRNGPMLPGQERDLAPIDFDSAVVAAKATGPMVEMPTPVQAMMVAIMSFDGAKTPPTDAQIAAAIKDQMKPEPGPGAFALADLVRRLALQGRIEDAEWAEAMLPTDKGDVIALTRDEPLAHIADAKIKQGDLEGALKTALTIETPAWRWESLIKLLAEPASE